MKIIANEPVGNGCLRRNGFHRWVCLDGTICCVKTRVADAISTHATIVVLRVFHEPIHRIVGIGRFIHVFIRLPFIGGNDWAHVHKFVLAHPTPAHVLKNEDVTLFGEVHVLKTRYKFSRSVGCHGVRRSFEQHRIFFLFILWRVNSGKKFNAIAHRDLHLLFIKILTDVSRIRDFFNGGGFFLRKSKGEYALQKEKNKQFFHSKINFFIKKENFD